MKSRILIALALSAFSFSAFAHVGGDAHDHGGFLTGFLHPITGLDHLAAIPGCQIGLLRAVGTAEVNQHGVAAAAGPEAVHLGQRAADA